MIRSTALIHVRNLTIFAADRILVKGLDLDIFPQDMLGIAGESGSGKTMTIRAILGILPKGVDFTADEFTLFGTDCRSLSVSARRKLIGDKIGFIPQNTVFYLHPMMKIKEQIADGYVAHKHGNRKQGLERASELLGAVGFEDPDRILNSYGWELSGGMRQRVNIAMSLMNAPDILIADEPTTALDAAIQKQIMDLFDTINKETGIAILMVSHDLGMLENYSRRTLVMYAGRMVEQGPTSTLFRYPAHPYTKALLKVVPSLDHDPDIRLPEISGYVPDSGRDTDSCIFAPRCPYAKEECLQPLKLEVFGRGHRCLCIFAKGGLTEDEE